jgi:hypothetical protein
MHPNRSSRREFLGQALAASLAPALARGARATAVGGPYIDVHTHLGTTWNGDPPLTVDGLLSWMDEQNVARAVVLPLVSPESSSYLNLTERALDAARAHPDRLIAFCCIDPRTSYRGGRPGLTPIEEMVSKVKGSLRSAAARTKETVHAAFGSALHNVTLDDIAGWFQDRAAYAMQL